MSKIYQNRGGTLTLVSDDDNAVHKTGDETIAGTKTFSSTITGSVSGNAGTATQFSANTTVALTGDVTGTSAGSKKGWSVPTTLANSGVTAGSYGPSANATPGYGATFNVPYITVDAKGRVTAAATHTVKIPASDDTNNKVSQTVSTDNAELPILAKDSNGTTTVTSGSKFAAAVKLNPSTGTITATKFVGPLTGDVTGGCSGNAGSATKLATARNIAVSGAVTGSASFNGTANSTISTIWRSCMVGQSGSTNTNPWYKVASFAATTANDDIEAVFLVENTYSTHTYGLLKLHVRTNGSKVIDANASSLAWLSHNGFTLADFVLVMPTAASSTFELWTKIDVAYQYRRFTILSEGSRTGTSVRFTLHPASSAGQAASITTTGTQKASTFTGQAASCTGNAATVTGTAGTSALAWNSEVTLYTVGGHAIKAKLPANPNTDTDTKNTAGSTDTSSKIFLIGATSQAANPQTYSHDTAYVGTDGCLYSGGTKVLTAHQSLSNYLTKTTNVSEMGRYIDMHYDNATSAYDYDVRLQVNSQGTAAGGGVLQIVGASVKASKFEGPLTGNASSATKVSAAPAGTTYVAAVTAGNANVTSTATGFGAVWNAPTKNYRVGMATYPSSNDQILWYSVTNANVTAGTNTVNKSMSWDGGTGILTATGFSGPLTGNVTGNCSGTAANVTGTVAIANGGTGATTRLNAVKALTNENVSTGAQYFLTITSSWGKAGYTSTADAKTVLAMTGATSSANGTAGVVPAPPKGGQSTKYLRADGTWQVPPDNNTVYTHPTTSGNKHIPSGGSSGQILRWSADGTAAWGADNNTTYSDATTSAHGLMTAADKTKLNGIATSAGKYTLVATYTFSNNDGVSKTVTGLTVGQPVILIHKANSDEGSWLYYKSSSGTNQARSSGRCYTIGCPNWEYTDSAGPNCGVFIPTATSVTFYFESGSDDTIYVYKT